VSQQQGNANDSDSIFLVVIVGVIALIAIWYFYGAAITAAYFQLKKLELLLFWPIASHFQDAQDAMNFMTNTPPKKVSIGQIMEVARICAHFFNVVTVGVLGFMTWRAIKRNPIERFRHEHSMKTLLASEKALWSAVAPVAGLNIIDQDIKKGPWAMSMRPIDFARRYKLLNEENKLDVDRTEKLFASQLGRLWEGPSKLRAPTRALFAIFAAFGNGDKAGAEAALDKLNYSFAAGKPDFTWVGPMLEKHARSPEIIKLCNSHAYVNTVMASMLNRARKMGPLPSCSFIWLKPVNRPLWYVLNGVGRRVAFAEVAGIYGHWIAEQVAEHPLERPFVKNAVNALKWHFENEIRID
jgi:intracellular multiplication protein IcmP